MKSLIRNKRGEGNLLGEETVKVIVSILSISILLILAGSLFYVFIKSTKLRQAEGLLEEIVRTIDVLQEGEVSGVLVTGPEGWNILQRENELCICGEKDVEKCGNEDLAVCEELVENFILKNDASFSIDSGVILGENIVIDDIFELYISIKDGNVMITKTNFYEIEDFMESSIELEGKEIFVKDFIFGYFSGNIKKDLGVLYGERSLSYSFNNRDEVKEKIIQKTFSEYFNGKDVDSMEAKISGKVLLSVRDADIRSSDSLVYSYTILKVDDSAVILYFYS